MKRWMACLWILLTLAALGAVDLLIVTGASNIARLAAGELKQTFGDRLRFASIDASIAGEISVYGAELRLGSGDPFLEIPRATLRFSGHSWLGPGADVQTVELHQPHVRIDAHQLTQADRDGQSRAAWPDQLPPILSRDGTLTLMGMGFFDSDLGPRFKIRDLSFSPVPSRGYYLSGRLDGDILGTWEIRGEISPEGAMDMELQSKNFRFGREAYLKLSRSVREAWDRYAPSGSASWRVRIQKPDARSELTWTAWLHLDGMQATFRNIPYPLDGLGGEIEFTAHGFTIRQVESRSKQAAVVIRGGATGYASSAGYEVTAEFENAPLDSRMYHALPEAARKIWDELNPAGRANVRVDIVRPQGENQQDRITVRGRVTQGILVPRSMPCRWEQVEGEVFVRDDRMDIPWFSARVSGGEVTGTGSFDRLGAGMDADLSLRVASMDLTEETRKNLSVYLGDILDRVQPSGQVDVDLSVKSGSSEGARLKTRIGFRDARMKLGVAMDHITGEATLAAVLGKTPSPWTGTVRFSRIDIQGGAFRNLEGAYRYQGDELALDDIHAELCGGAVRGKMTVRLQEGSYQGGFSAQGIDLAEYMKDGAAPGKKVQGRLSVDFKNLTGNLKDGESLRGEGTMALSEGDLWDIPVLYNILTLNLFNVARKPALRTGQLTCALHGQVFQIGDLVLEGEGMRIQGKGKIFFNGNLDLVLNTRISTSLGIPGVNLIEGALDLIKDNLYAVEITGTFAAPVHKAKVLPSLTGDK